MILYLDTALTGRYAYKEQDDAAIQPHLCRFAALLVDETSGAECLEYSRLVQPRFGWIYETEAIVATGISRQRAVEEGDPVETVLSHFLQMRAVADLIVGFNWDHQRRVLQRTAADCCTPFDPPLPKVGSAGCLCTMRQSTDLVRKPRWQPGGGYAWPKMAEAIEFFTDAPMPPRDPDPVAHGLAVVRTIRRIHEGILRGGR